MASPPEYVQAAIVLAAAAVFYLVLFWLMRRLKEFRILGVTLVVCLTVMLSMPLWMPQTGLWTP